MKATLLIIPVLLALGACSRPETPPPTTPAQPPTVENNVAPGPTAPGEVH